MNYIHSDGPYSEINDIEGIEIPVWFVSECDDNDDEIKDYGKFYNCKDAIEYADKIAQQKKIEHVCDAGRA